MWNLIVSVPDHCLSFYFESFSDLKSKRISNDLKQGYNNFK